LSRFPSTNDRKVFEAGRQRAKDRTAAFNDTIWALVNVPEFRLQH
jgi:hypothetical protein